MDPRDGYVQVNDLRFHYLEWGTSDKKPMLLLHGGTQTAHSWDELSRAMAGEYRVLALDQRGHGETEWAPDRNYGLEAYVSDIVGFTEALGLERFLLMGLSLGGRNSMVYASRYPARLEALVIVDVGPEVMQEGVESIRRFVGGPDELDSFEAFVELAHRFNPRRSLENLRERLSHNLKQLESGKWTWKYDRAFRDPNWRAAPEPPIDLWECLKKIGCPTLIVRGAQSDVLSPQVVERMRQLLPQGRSAVVEGAGHSVMGDNPAGFEAAVRGFLGQMESRLAFDTP